MIKMKKTLFILLIVFLLCFTTFSHAKNTSSEYLKNTQLTNFSSSANWTLLYYICADSHLDNETDPLLENLSAIGSTQDMNIVCLVDKSGDNDTQLIYITNTGEIQVLNQLYGWPDEVDTGDLTILQFFCNQMMQAYPAKYYWLVVFAVGGAGWQGFTTADQDSNYYIPSTPEFAEALKKITERNSHKINVLATPCITGMLEVAHELAPYVDYLTTTEEHTPDGPVHYIRFFKAVWDLHNNTGMTPEEFSSMVPLRHEPYTFSFFSGTEHPLTKLLNKLPFKNLHTVIKHTQSSAVNLSRVQSLTSSVDSLATLLLSNIRNINVKNAIKTARNQAREYGKGYPKYFVFSLFYQKFPLEIFAYNSYIDLYNLIEILKENVDSEEIKTACDNVMNSLNETIILETSYPDDSSHGLSIYFPKTKLQYNHYLFGGKTPSKYEELQFSNDTNWDEFLKTYLNI